MFDSFHGISYDSATGVISYKGPAPSNFRGMLSTIYCDLKIPENFASVIKNGLPIEAKFSGYKNKIYKGEKNIKTYKGEFI